MKERIKIKKIILSIIIFLIFYQLLSFGFKNEKIFPSIVTIITVSFPEIGLFNGKCTSPSYYFAFTTVIEHMFYTLRRILLGGVFGIIFGILFGSFIHFYEKVQKGNIVILFALKGVPLFALIPLFLFWSGGGEYGAIMYIAFAVFVLFSVSTYEAIATLPLTYNKLRRIYNLSIFDYYKHIVFFSILPEIIGTLVNVSGIIFAFSLGAEMYGCKNGLGYLIYYSFMHSSMGKLFIFSFIYILLGFLLLLLVDLLQNKILKWL